MIKIILLTFLSLIIFPVFSSDIPHLFEVKIGEPFPVGPIFKKGANPKLGVKPRPTEQFSVPNSGDSKILFPEYQILVLKATNQVSVISATRVFFTHEECEESAVILKKWVKGTYPTLEYSTDDYDYRAKSENNFVTVMCLIEEDGRFTKLRYSVRGKIQDAALKKSWDQYFN